MRRVWTERHSHVKAILQDHAFYEAAFTMALLMTGLPWRGPSSLALWNAMCNALRRITLRVDREWRIESENENLERIGEEEIVKEEDPRNWVKSCKGVQWGYRSNDHVQSRNLFGPQLKIEMHPCFGPRLMRSCRRQFPSGSNETNDFYVLYHEMKTFWTQGPKVDETYRIF